MPRIELKNYCCQGGQKVIDTNHMNLKDLDISVRGNRALRFSPLGNRPKSPKIALVGITPGSQSEVFASHLRTTSVEEAAKCAAFERGQRQIKEMLHSHGFANSIGLDLCGDLNDNPAVFTTSLVKCCLMVQGSYKYKAPDIVASPEATFCVINRFLGDMHQYSTIEWVIIFGDSGWDAVNTLRSGGKTIRGSIEATGAAVLNFPHFAQNFQQRAIFCLSQEAEDTYLRKKPGHFPYANRARVMRSALLSAMERRARVA
jgi:hypothetical protein